MTTSEIDMDIFSLYLCHIEHCTKVAIKHIPYQLVYGMHSLISI